MDPESEPNELSPRLTDPAPVLAAGLALWIAATVVVLLVGERWSSALPVCWAGIGVGATGYVVFLVQRAASRRGKKTAQRGLN
ncbi:MAG: DUF2530 domain-containing protein [Rhodococcus fascians]|uniref:DUF2530 domain-containing protein n=1 Tax=Nocardiaceae TaxID=85025 RepID=UPI00036B74A5|nr:MULTISPECIES: DUF2530 domain-containing protein [Rhodococcus]OZC55222.1 DUF2530 domain-containing protein [Rhodococcus sp. 06-621-2]OZC88293.1 DUF2530 domain-containing protein [Rhodococcus sp. 06-418-1B]OZD11864.1 DUF2530 domain-containing protein [Rhodococcus sp. 06-156-4C]OZD23528.1 DUF2530 domain-containing protein [Rhodococcus sp. 06-156-4a]OZD27046.1 DUF2530 domain-containing protein [Rhodococcus sp. 06-156-3C]